jgi:hypothetical protein
MANFQRTQAKTTTKTTGANTAPPVIAAAKPASVLASAIAQRAYELWQQNGCPHGRDQEHWFQAERELRGRAARN